MLKVLAVCGHGIGSCLMLKMKIKELCEEYGIQSIIESTDVESAQEKKCDLIITTKQLVNQFEGKEVACVSSYVNNKKIKDDVLNILLHKANAIAN